MKNLGLSAKMYFVIGLLSVAAISLAGVGIWGMNEIHESLVEMEEDADHELLAMAELHNKFQEMQILEYRYATADNGARKGIGEHLEGAQSELATQLREANAKATGSDKVEIAKFETQTNSWLSLSKDIRALADAGKMDAAIAAISKQEDASIAAENIIRDLVKEGYETMQQGRVHAEGDYRTARSVLLALTIISIGAGLAVSIVILRGVTRAIDQVISDLGSNSDQVTSASAQIASSSEELSQAAAEQASSLGETASAVEEMSATIKKNSDNAESASTSSEKSHASATKGKEVIHNMISTVDEINASNNRIMEQINHSNAQISEITKVIAEIANKTKVINDIVFQTKLLSFNASVEAARAGEHGKGFAVVAEEVGNLAQMSGNAAKEIGEMLDGSIHKVESIVSETKTSVEKLIEEGKTKVVAGTEVARQCGTVLDEIVQDTKSANVMIREISTASREQAQGIQEVTKAMGQLDQVTQQNAAASEQTASAAEQLSAQAESLKGVVGVLVATIKGQGARALMADKIPVARRHIVKNGPHGKIVHTETKSPAEKAGIAEPVAFKAAVGSETVAADDPRFVEV